MNMKKERILRLFVSAFCVVCLLLPQGISLASGTQEATYTITETELSQLETNLAQLSAINTKLQMDLKVQSQEATALKKEVTELKKQLEQLKSLSEKQEDSLMNANKLLEEYAIEAKKERLRIKAQRNFFEILAAGAIIYAACK